MSDTEPAARGADRLPSRRQGRKRRGRPIDGWLILDKPQGPTSTDIVNRVRRAFDAQKAGHGGTLDPLATGVLPVAFGAATKTVPYVQDGTKLYRFTLRFGEARDTDDAEGRIIGQSAHRPDDAAIRAALGALTGDILQIPPAFSAIKVAGERAYDMARDGRPPALEPRPARVDRFELIARPDADHAEFEVESGKGVYMRSLARDLAQACATLGHVGALRRLRVGPFRIEDAVQLDQCVRATPEDPPPPLSLLRPAGHALADLPEFLCSPVEAAMLGQGQKLGLDAVTARLPAVDARAGGICRVMVGARLVGLARVEDGLLRPIRML